jgi:hypothetical protein
VRRAAALAPMLFALGVIGGCGGDNADSDRGRSEKTTTERQSSLLARSVSAWSVAATSYSAILQQCGRQPNPIRGFVAACTRQYRTRYDREARRLSLALRTERSRSRSCSRLLRNARPPMRRVTNALRRAYRNFRAFHDALVTDRDYRGPPILALLEQTDGVTRRNAKSAEALSPAIPKQCPGA